MSWTFYLVVWGLFTLVFAIFYGIAYSVLLGVRDNYLRHCQKADLQWTGAASSRPGRIPVRWLLGMALLTAWLVTEFIIEP